MRNPQQLAQALMSGQGSVSQPNMLSSFLPTNNEQGQLVYPTSALQRYAQGRPMYMAGPTNNPIVNDMAHRMMTSSNPQNRLFGNIFSFRPPSTGQSIFDQLAAKIPYK